MFLIRSLRFLIVLILYIFCNFQAIFYSISLSTVVAIGVVPPPLCCPLEMTDFIVISDILLCEFVMLAKNKINK